MASYGPIYEFAFDSQNGADILIVISKKSYTGAVTRRPLGRAPILKRENNENIYGTSLEIYAECKVDGEYAEFYTSSADEFKVDVYKDQVLIWTGFITPELYSEPDIAPPYDVQIIATDGLGELRDLTFYSNETKSVYEHIKSMLDAMNATRLYGIISDLKYVSGDFVSGAAGLFDMRVNLEHEVGNNCYDVLQNILRSINASMTLYGDSWLIFRKTDFIRLAEEDWVHGAYSNGHETLYPVAEFGSMDKTNWWPIGQMSSVIEPAKKSVVFQAPNHYKRNALSDAWVISDSTSYDNIQKAYTLSSKDAYITQHIDFGAEIGYALSLKIKAMNVGAPIFDIKKGNYIDQGIGVRVKVVDEDGHPMYLESLDSDRGIGSYHWVSDESTWIEGDLALPALSDRKSDAQEVEIIIPLYVSTPMSKALATSMDVTVFNIDGTYPINIYNISLGAHDQAPGYEANVVLNNNAREEGDSVETTFSDAYRLANAGYIFMSGIPMLPYQDVAIGSWQINEGEARDYVTTMAEDYAMQSALPRMSYRGVLNVPRANLPVLFLRDGTYYFPRTYSYNLYDDELEVELISVPAADVEVSSIVVSEYTPSYGASSGSSGGSGSGGGSGIGGGIDLSGYAKKEEVTTLSELLASMWTIDEETGDLVTDRNVRIAKNVIIGGDMSSAAKGRDAGAAGGIIGVKVGDAEYTDITDGILDMTDAFKDLDVDLSDYYTNEETDAKIAESLIPYAKIADIGSTYATKASLETLQGEVDNIEAILGMDEEAEGIINTWNEVKAFLDGYSSSDDLAAILSTMNADIAKRALDSDLDTLAGRVGVNELAIADNAGNIKKNFDAIGVLESNKADKATTLAGYGITDAYTKVNVDDLLKKYLLLEAESQTIKGNLKIEGNLIIAGDMSSEGTGGNSGADGTVIGVVVNGTQYADETNGMLDLSSLMNQYLPLTYSATNTSGQTITVSGSSDYIRLLKIFAPDLGAAKHTSFQVGVADSAYNNAQIAFYYAGKDSRNNFATFGMHTVDDQLTINGYGNVGIGLGTTAPSYKLHVNGTFNATTIYQNGSSLSSILNGYLPLSGGTIDGSGLNVKASHNAPLALFTSATSNRIAFYNSGSLYGYLAFNEQNKPLFIESSGAVRTLYHTGNFNPADYLPKSGGTISNASYAPFGLRNTETNADAVGIAFRIKDAGIAYMLHRGGDQWELISENWATQRTIIHSGNSTSYNAGGLAHSNGAVGATVYSTGALLVNNAGIYTQDASYQLLRFDGTALNVGYSMRKFNPTIIHGNTIQFNIGDASKMLINSSGNVTFGASDLAGTSAKLYVDGKAIANGNVDVRANSNGNAGVGLYMNNTSAEGYLFSARGSESAKSLRLYYMPNSNDTFKQLVDFTPSGNVLIGATTDSGYKLDVNGTARVGHNAAGGSLLTFNMDRPWTFYQQNSGSGSNLALIASTQNKAFFIQNSASQNLIGFYAYDTPYVNIISRAVLDKTLDVAGAVTMSSTLSVGNAVSITKTSGTTVGTGALYITENGNAQWLRTLQIIASNLTSGSSACISVGKADSKYNQAQLYYHHVSDGSTSNFVGIGLHSVDHALTIHANGNVGVGLGTTSPSAKLHVGGDIIIAGDMSSTSDMRLKQRIDDVVFDLKTIAEMPLFTFRWKDGRDDRLHLGSSAQYWEKPAPWLVMGDETKTLNYAVLGVAGVKALAVTAVDHETRIKMLERKVNELETENRRLRYGN